MAIYGHIWPYTTTRNLVNRIKTIIFQHFIEKKAYFFIEKLAVYGHNSKVPAWIPPEASRAISVGKFDELDKICGPNHRKKTACLFECEAFALEHVIASYLAYGVPSKPSFVFKPKSSAGEACHGQCYQRFGVPGHLKLASAI